MARGIAVWTDGACAWPMLDMEDDVAPVRLVDCPHSVLCVGPVEPGQDPFDGVHTCEACGSVVEFDE